MSKRKIEVNEDDFKKILLILKLSKGYLKLPSQDLFLTNLWRVAPKLADKLMRKENLVLVQSKGRMSIKDASEVPADATIMGGGNVSALKVETPSEETAEVPVTETSAEVEVKESEAEPPTPITDEYRKVHRCRKRHKK